MSLFDITRSCIGRVNPNIVVAVERYAGAETAADGRRTAVYSEAEYVAAQQQPLQFDDLKQIDGLNITGERSVFFLSGTDYKAVNRADNRGGDVIILPPTAQNRAGSKWLIVFVAEAWITGWSKVIATRQLGGSACP